MPTRLLWRSRNPISAWDAYQGQIKGLSEKVGVRAISALYSNYMHIVALDGSGIKTINDLKGKRVSTGAPGSGTEVKGLRVLEAYGISPKDLKSQDRLGAAESAGAMKDRRIDAFIWDGGLPTAAVLDLRAPRRASKSSSFRTAIPLRRW